MIIKREKLYRKKHGIYMDTYKRTSYWLLGIIPIYIDNKLLNSVI